jgi:hypothetical protein
MRVTKRRQQRAKTINPNPPICRSKEMSFTYLNFFDCLSNAQLKTFEKYGQTYEHAKDSAAAPAGQYAIGYYYQPDFHVFENLANYNCTINPNWIDWYINPASELICHIELYPEFSSYHGINDTQFYWDETGQPNLPCNFTINSQAWATHDPDSWFWYCFWSLEFEDKRVNNYFQFVTNWDTNAPRTKSPCAKSIVLIP